MEGPHLGTEQGDKSSRAQIETPRSGRPFRQAALPNPLSSRRNGGGWTRTNVGGAAGENKVGDISLKSTPHVKGNPRAVERAGGSTRRKGMEGLGS